MSKVTDALDALEQWEIRVIEAQAAANAFPPEDQSVEAVQARFMHALALTLCLGAVKDAERALSEILD